MIQQTLKAMGVGLAVGAIVGMAVVPKRSSPMKKRAKHALKLAARCVDDLSSAMGL